MLMREGYTGQSYTQEGAPLVPCHAYVVGRCAMDPHALFRQGQCRERAVLVAAHGAKHARPTQARPRGGGGEEVPAVLGGRR